MYNCIIALFVLPLFSHRELRSRDAKVIFPTFGRKSKCSVCVFFLQSGTDNTTRGGRSERDEKHSNHHLLGISFFFLIRGEQKLRMFP